MHRFILLIALAAAPSRLSAQPLPEPGDYEDCAEIAASNPSCVLELAYRNVVSNDPEREIIYRTIKIFRKNGIFDVFGPITPAEEAARRAAEDWLLVRFADADLVDERGFLRQKYADYLTILAESGMPRAVKALLPPGWADHPLNACLSDSLQATAYAVIGDGLSALDALTRGREQFYLAQQNISESGQLVGDCNIVDWGVWAVGQMLTHGDAAAADALYQIIAPVPGMKAIRISSLAGRIPPNAIESLLAQISDPELEAELRRALVISLATHERLDDATRSATSIRDDPNRGFAMGVLVGRYVSAGRVEEARAMAAADPLVSQTLIDSLIKLRRNEATSASTRREYPTSVALEGRLEDAIRLVGNPDASWNNRATSDAARAMNRVPHLIAIYMLAVGGKK